MTPEATSANGETYAHAQARRLASEAKHRDLVPPPDDGRRAEPQPHRIAWDQVGWIIAAVFGPGLALYIILNLTGSL